MKTLSLFPTSPRGGLFSMSYPMSFSRREVSRFKHHLFYHYGLQVHSLEGHRLPLSAEVVAWIKCDRLHKCYPQVGLTPFCLLFTLTPVILRYSDIMRNSTLTFSNSRIPLPDPVVRRDSNPELFSIMVLGISKFL